MNKILQRTSLEDHCCTFNSNVYRFWRLHRFFYLLFYVIQGDSTFLSAARLHRLYYSLTSGADLEELLFLRVFIRISPGYHFTTAIYLREKQRTHYQELLSAVEIILDANRRIKSSSSFRSRTKPAGYVAINVFAPLSANSADNSGASKLVMSREGSI